MSRRPGRPLPKRLSGFWTSRHPAGHSGSIGDVIAATTLCLTADNNRVGSPRLPTSSQAVKCASTETESPRGPGPAPLRSHTHFLPAHCPGRPGSWRPKPDLLFVLWFPLPGSETPPPTYLSCLFSTLGPLFRLCLVGRADLEHRSCSILGRPAQAWQPSWWYPGLLIPGSPLPSLFSAHWAEPLTFHIPGRFPDPPLETCPTQRPCGGLGLQLASATLPVQCPGTAVDEASGGLGG